MREWCRRNDRSAGADHGLPRPDAEAGATREALPLEDGDGAAADDGQAAGIDYLNAARERQPGVASAANDRHEQDKLLQAGYKKKALQLFEGRSFG